MYHHHAWSDLLLRRQCRRHDPSLLVYWTEMHQQAAVVGMTAGSYYKRQVLRATTSTNGGFQSDPSAQHKEASHIVKCLRCARRLTPGRRRVPRAASLCAGACRLAPAQQPMQSVLAPRVLCAWFRNSGSTGATIFGCTAPSVISRGAVRRPRQCPLPAQSALQSRQPWKPCGEGRGVQS